VNLLVGAATIGLILAPLALGVFLSYRLYRWLDLTVDGSFGVGAAVVAALLVRDMPPSAATTVGAVAGVAAGALTGIMHTRLRVSPLLAGVLNSTALYSVILFIMGSGNLSLASSESLTAAAGRLGELVGISSNVGVLIAVALLAAALGLGLALFLGTDLGLAMRASGNNPQMAKAVGIDVDWMVVLGLGISNGLVALSGAVYAQYQGFANIQMGIGAIVTGVATLMVGESLVGRRSLGRWIAAAIAGAVIYRLAVAGALRAGLNPNALKLVTALFVLAVLVAPDLARRARRSHD
jgi:putative tryptophan/tyrosine transport system permease protein